MKRDIPRLRDALDLPNEITCHLYNGLVVNCTEALCIVLSRLAYPCRYVDMVSLFGRSVPQLKFVSPIFYQTLIFSPKDNPSKTKKSTFYFI